MSFSRAIATLCVIAGSLAAQAPSWQTATTLPDIDLTGLTAAQKDGALKTMRDTGCTCGCGMKVAQCRVEDPPCTYSKGLAALIIKGFKDGKNEGEVKKIVASSALGRPRPAPKVLDDAVEIPTSGAPATGPAAARVLLVEFSDFECPFCAQAASELHHVLAAYPRDVRLVYKQFPLSMHPHAGLAALASLAAQEQGKFWEMHDQMFAHYRQLSRENLVAWAQQLGMDVDKFNAALDSPKNKAVVKKDTQDGELAGVNGTPSIYVNGKHLNASISLAALKPILEEELKHPVAHR